MSKPITLSSNPKIRFFTCDSQPAYIYELREIIIDKLLPSELMNFNPKLSDPSTCESETARLSKEIMRVGENSVFITDNLEIAKVLSKCGAHFILLKKEMGVGYNDELLRVARNAIVSGDFTELNELNTLCLNFNFACLVAKSYHMLKDRMVGDFLNPTAGQTYCHLLTGISLMISDHSSYPNYDRDQLRSFAENIASKETAKALSVPSIPQALAAEAGAAAAAITFTKPPVVRHPIRVEPEAAEAGARAGAAFSTPQLHRRGASVALNPALLERAHSLDDVRNPARARGEDGSPLAGGTTPSAKSVASTGAAQQLDSAKEHQQGGGAAAS